jgi:hypothetical protein
MNDDEVIRLRISGRSARIARAQATTVAEVNKALDRFTETTIRQSPQAHAGVRACQTRRIARNVPTHYPLEGDVQCGALVTKIIERRCTMLGLYTPQTAMLQVIEADAPRETSTDKISALIHRIRGKTRDDPDNPPSTH